MYNVLLCCVIYIANTPFIAHNLCLLYHFYYGVKYYNACSEISYNAEIWARVYRCMIEIRKYPYRVESGNATS